MTRIVSVENSTGVEILTGVRALGRALGIPKSSAHRMLRRGSFPGQFDGARWRVLRAAAVAYLAALAESERALPPQAPGGSGVLLPRPARGGRPSRRKNTGGKVGCADNSLQKQGPAAHAEPAEQGTTAAAAQNVGNGAEVPTLCNEPATPMSPVAVEPGR